MFSHTRRLSYDPVTGIAEYIQYDPSTKLSKIITRQDVTDLVANNREHLKEATVTGVDMRRVARIPMSVYVEWMKQGVFKDKKELARRLNDPDNRFFRTTNERV